MRITPDFIANLKASIARYNEGSTKPEGSRL
jgi:hypothetical protein